MSESRPVSQQLFIIFIIAVQPGAADVFTQWGSVKHNNTKTLFIS